MTVMTLIKRISSRWDSMNHPQKVFGGYTYTFVGWMSSKNRTKNLLNYIRQRGFPARAMYTPISRATKPSFIDDPLYLRRLIGGFKEVPAWSVYVKGSRETVRKLAVPSLQSAFDRPRR